MSAHEPVPAGSAIRRFAVAMLIVILSSIAACSPSTSERGAAADDDGTLSVAAALDAGDTTGYLRATEPREFRFPEDHGPHPGFRTEWWYFTGNLWAAEGGARRFGFQLTFFRNQLAPPAAGPPPPRESAWSTDSVYMGHFALTDAAGERFYAFERFARQAVGLAGAQAGTAPRAGTGNGDAAFRVWLEDWEARGEAADGSIPPLRLRARQDDVALDLVLLPGKSPVLQGERGLSRKGPEPGNASYYYSLTRLPARGVVTLGDERYPVRGQAWMDREWSTSVLSPGQVGWDWFSLQLADGRDLMLYQLRRENGEPDASSAGLLVTEDGGSRYLGAGDFTLTPLATWTSATSGADYPVRWRVRVPSADLDLQISPLLPAQELNLTFRYWEGAITIRDHGEVDGPGIGVGYAELTGY